MTIKPVGTETIKQPRNVSRLGYTTPFTPTHYQYIYIYIYVERRIFYIQNFSHIRPADRVHHKRFCLRRSIYPSAGKFTNLSVVHAKPPSGGTLVVSLNKPKRRDSILTVSIIFRMLCEWLLKRHTRGFRLPYTGTEINAASRYWKFDSGNFTYPSLHHCIYALIKLNDDSEGRLPPPRTNHPTPLPIIILKIQFW